MYKDKRLFMLAGLIVMLAAFAAIAGTKDGAPFNTERHMRYTLYIGLNDGDKGVQLHSTEEARKMVNDIACKYVGGYTLYEAEGFWKEDGQDFNEHTLVCVIIDASEEAVRSILDETRKALNQHSILLEVGEVMSTYYGGEE